MNRQRHLKAEKMAKTAKYGLQLMPLITPTILEI